MISCMRTLIINSSRLLNLRTSCAAPWSIEVDLSGAGGDAAAELGGDQGDKDNGTPKRTHFVCMYTCMFIYMFNYVCMHVRMHVMYVMDIWM